MRRGFVYSLAALALCLAVAQAAIIFSSSQSGIAYGRDRQKDAAGFAAFSEGAVGLQSDLLVSCGLAAAAAKGYEESMNSTFANKTCVLTYLARYGNATNATCPGEAFALIETTDKGYSLSGWQQGAPLRRAGIVETSVKIIATYATGNATHTTCSATALVTAATPDNSTFISRQYAAQRTVPNP